MSTKPAAAQIYYYRKGRRIKDPCWAIRTVNLIKDYSSDLNDLAILYKKNRVENLSVSKIMFWNHGADTINRQDIADADPIRITGKVKILDAKLLTVNNRPSDFLLSISGRDGSINVAFDYLDKAQGAILQVVHEGTSSKDLILVGSIKGAETIRLVNVTAYTDQIEETLKSIMNVILFSALSFYFFSDLGTDSDWKLIVRILMGVLFVAIGMLSLWVMIHEWNQRAVSPKGLESFHDEILSKAK